MTTKGILMAGGRGSRLGPLTGGASKHLLPVHDKPMVFYPLSLMISMGIREVLLVADPVDVIAYRRLLGDGSCFGVTLDVIAQPNPGGLAEGILLAADFIDHQPVAMVLGDNLLHARRPSAPSSWTPPRRGAHILAMPVADPTRFGVVTLDASGRATDLVEKPSLPQSNLAVPGVYLYDGDVVEMTRTVSPSPRGELEITDVNRAYLRRGDLHVTVLPKGTVWHDAGTVESLHDAAAWVRREQSLMHRWVGVPEEAAWRAGRLRAGQLRARGHALLPSAYGQHLIDLAADSAPATAPARRLTPAA